MTISTCTSCQSHFHLFDGDDMPVCLSCLDRMDAQGVEFDHVAPLVAGVRAFASANYEKGRGWDHVVEATDDAELVKLIGKAKTVDAAIGAVWSKKVRYIWYANRDARGEMVAAYFTGVL